MYNRLTSIIDAIKNSLRRLVFREIMRLPLRSHPSDDAASDPSVWPQIRDAFWAKSTSDFVTLNDNVDKNKKLLDKKMRAAIEGRSELSSENRSEQEYNPHAVRLTSQQMIDCNSRRQRIPSTAATRQLHSSAAVYWNAAPSPPPPSSLKSICLCFFALYCRHSLFVMTSLGIITKVSEEGQSSAPSSCPRESPPHKSQVWILQTLDKMDTFWLIIRVVATRVDCTCT